MNDPKDKLDFVGTTVPPEIKKKLQIYLILHNKDLRTWLIETVERLEKEGKIQIN